jgi:hypothetical protein
MNINKIIELKKRIISDKEQSIGLRFELMAEIYNFVTKHQLDLLEETKAKEKFNDLIGQHFSDIMNIKDQSELTSKLDLILHRLSPFEDKELDPDGTDLVSRKYLEEYLSSITNIEKKELRKRKLFFRFLFSDKSKLIMTFLLAIVLLNIWNSSGPNSNNELFSKNEILRSLNNLIISLFVLLGFFKVLLEIPTAIFIWIFERFKKLYRKKLNKNKL